MMRKQQNQNKPSYPAIGDVIVHRDKLDQKVNRLFKGGADGCGVESGDFYRLHHLTYIGPAKQGGGHKWRAPCGVEFKEGTPGSFDGCCLSKKRQ